MRARGKSSSPSRTPACPADHGAVGTSGGTGYTKRYSYDRCAVVAPPPYFPTTGRFQENRYVELDTAGFEHTTYFKSITPEP